MTTFARDEDRRVVPRWRFQFDLSGAADSSGDPRFRRPPEYENSYLRQRALDWASERSLATAADLVVGALATGHPDQGIDAANYLLEARERLLPGVVTLAQKCLGSAAVSEPAATGQRALLLPPDLVSLSRSTIRMARARIERNAGNAGAWLDMSRAYAILGQKPLAERAMTRALGVSPDHRLVLRSAARLFLHLQDRERAAKLLSTHPRTRVDPWLLASEIAIASIAQRTSKNMRAARELVTSDKLPPSHLAELHSALATVDFDHGSVRQARRHARESLVDPNDNCAAQARWLAVRLPEIVVTSEAFELARSYEARCWRALRLGDWSEALSEAHGWLLDEPYSSRPAIIGSFIGVTLTEDHEFGAACARIGVQAHPTNRTLRNNLAVALGYLGRVSEAVEVYRSILQKYDDEFPEFVYRATGGLLSFRGGNAAEGRALYQQSMELAPRNMRARVLAYWLREELNAAPWAADTTLELCDKLLTLAREPFTRRLVELVRSKAQGYRALAIGSVGRSGSNELLSVPTLSIGTIPRDDDL